MEAMLIKSPGGLVPMDDSEAEKLAKFKSGTVIRCEVREMRNGAFFKKWWALAKLAFDMAVERMQPTEYKGAQVLPSFDRFRKDLTIMAGYFDPVFNAKGELRLEPKSLRWSEMSEEEFEKLYSATIDCILQKILPHVKPAELDRAIRLTMGFA